MATKILFITLSNIGDAVLTLPVLDKLKESFTPCLITVVASPRSFEVFKDNPYIERVIIYNKKWSLRKKVDLFFELKKQRFNIVVDVRNSLYGLLLPVKFRTSLFRFNPQYIKHKKYEHLYLIRKIIPDFLKETKQKIFYIKEEDNRYIEELLQIYNLTLKDKIVVIASGAKSYLKLWPKENYVTLINELKKNFKVFLVGDKDDILINNYIFEKTKDNVYDLTGKTSLGQLASLLKRSALLISNDSAVMHLASYLDIPTVAIFGPTDEEKYRPWSKNYRVVKKEIFCRPCNKAQCRFKNLNCMKLIKPQDVLRAVEEILNSETQLPNSKFQSLKQYKRILIVRTDKIGDVVLSTPVIKTIRENYPSSFIAMMVSPYTRELLEGNPYLDEVIVYDKEKKHKGWLGSMHFSRELKKKKFELAIILHPTNRVHLVTFFAGIPKRVGYNKKLGFLLTDRLPHTKHLGEKHESEYNLDVIRYLGIKNISKELYIPIKREAQNFIEELFKKEGITEEDRILAIHPSATCPSKRWPPERFAEVADRLIEKYNFKVFIVAGIKDKEISKMVLKNMKYKAIDLAGKLSLSQLVSLLRKCQLFISNDSGPVHISSAIGVPVVSIFGRNQRGLSPLRWGPLGKYSRVIHKEVGCRECLAHKCIKGFLCLKVISVEDVLRVTEEIMNELINE
ncbi:MAG: lipopolysaccharide heptosyltransferase II [Candidatus Omnitrophica bacterium]|nr:lipopolysaccharide heptosyltransferase II [Candidatus Omnitrophota bacterium]